MLGCVRVGKETSGWRKGSAIAARWQCAAGPDLTACPETRLFISGIWGIFH
jgi:hypothetical protein